MSGHGHGLRRKGAEGTSGEGAERGRAWKGHERGGRGEGTSGLYRASGRIAPRGIPTGRVERKVERERPHDQVRTSPPPASSPVPALAAAHVVLVLVVVVSAARVDDRPVVGELDLVLIGRLRLRQLHVRKREREREREREEGARGVRARRG